MLSRVATRPTIMAAARHQLRRRLPTTQAAPRRNFHIYGDAKAGLDEQIQPRFTPLEEITMDCTAWFVAFALILTPEHDFGDDLDFQSLEEMEDKADIQQRQLRSKNEENKNSKGGLKSKKEQTQQGHQDHHD
jgi:hypothetical protein